MKICKLKLFFAIKCRNFAKKKTMDSHVFSHKIIKLNNEEVEKYSLPNKQIHISPISDGHYNNEPRSRHLHTHDFYVISWVECGNFEYTLDTSVYHIGDKTLLFIAPGQLHSYDSNSSIEGVSVFFTENFFSSLPESWSHYLKHNILYNLSCLESIDKKTILKFKTSLENLQRELELFSEHRDTYIGVYSALALLIYGVSETEEFKCISPKIEKTHKNSQMLYFSFLDKLEAQYTQYHSVQHYADELRVTINKLGACCKECSGETPTTIISNRILLEAKRLLIYSSKRSGEIANMLGFLEHAHFVNYFKKHINITPTEFRTKYGRRP